MKKYCDLNGGFEYELLGEDQQDIDLREKLAVLYSSPFTDILWWELRDSSLRYHTLYYYEQSVLKHIVLFKYSAKAPKKIMVINKVFKISIKNMENIGHILFCEFDKVQQIVFERLYAPTPPKVPKIIFEKTSNDVIIPDLPLSMDTYINSLGTSTRKHIKKRSKRIARDFSDFKVHNFEKNDIIYDQIERIVLFNKNRMKTKGIVSKLDNSECKALYQYAATSGFGFFCVCTIDDKIIGGLINSIIGEHAFAHVVAHDYSYKQYDIGQIIFVNSIKYLIEEKNIKYYHLLGGTYEYKFHLGGINHDLYTFRVFKNNNIYYCWGKTMRIFRVLYRSFKQILKDNKTIYSFYFKLNKMKMKILGI